MKIGICDDNIQWCCRVESIIAEYFRRHNISAETQCFFSGEELLALDGNPQLLFLDIDMKEKNGIETAKIANERWPHCQIVYLTNSLYFATEVYQTEHIYFVLKEQFEDKLDEVMEKAAHAFKQSEKNLVFSVIAGGEIVLSPDEIICIERTGRKSAIYCKTGTYRIWEKIKDVEQKLPTVDFVRCHNSCIIYLPAVRELLKDRFVMKNGKEILISRAYGKQAKEAFVEWAKTQIM
ncbi:LytR/AlgR family response regulator transcription factor [Hespellia stercorisuis]|uniref:Stage 0 sporulation protein A homolog n=1 Tax=Hespellia stercorisuis DSM 15480 TaxID=1121950 RepID=A0A1M6WKD2_9FIRM|nr:LytTR family DNA-binding domain-containing protein [Hespellia stercorisuis]SHK94161.1 two component transcriptional regulator, LytTR family [Hespellia stercorisuis DSM 15480]